MTRRRLTTLGIPAVAAAVLAGCGVGTDAQPRVIPPENVAFDLLEASTTTVTSLPANTVSKPIYFFNDADRLVAVDRPVPAPATAEGVLTALLSDANLEETSDKSYQTRIPAGTKLAGSVSSVDDEGVVRIDITNDLYNVEGPRLKQAIAQIVYTVTGYSDDVSLVEFSIDGSRSDVPNADGVNKTRVGRLDYRTYLR